MNNPVVKSAEKHESHLLGEYIGIAFAEDALSLWSMGDSTAIGSVYGLLAERFYVPAGQSTIAKGLGGALWLPPGKSTVPPLGVTLAIARHLFRGGGIQQVIRAIRVDRAMKLRHPTAPHYYLFAIGVLPDARGMGVGEQLLKHTLSIADRENMPAYLENTNPRNTPLYERVGFRAKKAFEPAPGCPPLIPMWRDPTKS